MSNGKAAQATPTQDSRAADLSRETEVSSLPVSEEFIEALRDAGARPSLVQLLERERTKKRVNR